MIPSDKTEALQSDPQLVPTAAQTQGDLRVDYRSAPRSDASQPGNCSGIKDVVMPGDGGVY